MFKKIFFQALAVSLSQWLIIKTLLTSKGLEFTGFYFFALSIIAPIFMLMGANYKNYATHPDFGAWENLIRRRLISMVFASVVSLLVLLFIETPLLVLLLVVTLKAVEFSIDSVQAYEIRFQRVRYIVVLAVLYVTFILIVYLSQFFSWLEFNNAITILVLCCLLIILMAYARCELFKVKKEIFNRGHDNSYIIKNIGIPACIVSLTSMIPRLSIELFMDATFLGVFGSLIYFYLIGHIFIIAMFQSNIVSIGHAHKNILLSLYKLALIFIFLSVIGLTTSILYGELILKLIFSEKLTNYSYLLPWFIGFIVIGCISTLFEQALIYIDENIFIAKLNYVLFVFAILLCPFLIRTFNFSGVILFMYIFYVSKLFVVHKRLNCVLLNRQTVH